jgi:trigger factor
LKIDQKPRDDHQVDVVVECSNEELDQFSVKAAQKISRDSKIPGFRPGKAPVSVIRRMYGDEYIQNRAIEMMVDDIYPKVLDEAKIKPSGPGSLEKIINTNPPTFSFIIPLEPEVDLKGYHSIRKPYTPPALDEAEVQRTLAEFQRMLAVAEPVDRPAAVGDLVYMKLSGTIQNPSEGQDPLIVKESDTQIWIGDTSTEDPFPYKGFDENLVGLVADDEKSVDFTYPKEYLYPELSEKTVQYHFIVLSIKFMKLPELNDEFAKSLGEFENYQALLDSIRARLTERTRDEYDQKYFDELLNTITSQSVIKYPPQMLGDEVDHLMEHFQEDLTAQKMDFETYLKLNNKTKETFIDEELKPAGKKRLERSLVLEQVAKEEKIQLSQEEINQELNATLSSLQGSKDFDKLTRKTNSQQLVNAMAVQAASRAMNRRVLSTLKSIATGEYQSNEKPEVELENKSPKKSRKKTETESTPVSDIPATSSVAKSSKSAGKATKKSKEKNEE